MDVQGFIQSFHFVNGRWVLLLPCFLMVADVLTGLVNAWAKRNIDSSKMRSGLAKKFGEISAIVIAEVCAFALQLPAEISAGISLYICFMELVSNVENLALLGVRVPTHWKDKLDQVNKYYFPDKDDDSVLDIEHSASEDDNKQ